MTEQLGEFLLVKLSFCSEKYLYGKEKNIPLPEKRILILRKKVYVPTVSQSTEESFSHFLYFCQLDPNVCSLDISPSIPFIRRGTINAAQTSASRNATAALETYLKRR